MKLAAGPQYIIVEKNAAQVDMEVDTCEICTQTVIATQTDIAGKVYSEENVMELGAIFRDKVSAEYAAQIDSLNADLDTLRDEFNNKFGSMNSSDDGVVPCSSATSASTHSPADFEKLDKKKELNGADAS